MFLNINNVLYFLNKKYYKPFIFFRTHMQDLVDVTRLVHYENFRHQRLRSGGSRHLNGLNGQALDIEQLNESSL